MSDIKARYVGGLEDGVDVVINFDNGEQRVAHVAKGGELPQEVDGLTVPASVRDSLLAQGDSWTKVKRDSGAQKAAEKGAGS